MTHTLSTRRFGVVFLDVGPHPETGDMIISYKCSDLERGIIVLSGLAESQMAASALCKRQLELLSLGCGSPWAAVVDITARTPS